MNKKNTLSNSQENCLRVIYELELTKKVARVKDISRKLAIRNSSVCQNLKQLDEKRMVCYRPHELLSLTDKGKETARSLYQKYKLIMDFLQTVFEIEPENAREVACCLEHVLSADLKKGIETLYKTVTRESLVKEILEKNLAVQS